MAETSQGGPVDRGLPAGPTVDRHILFDMQLSTPPLRRSILAIVAPARRGCRKACHGRANQPVHAADVSFVTAGGGQEGGGEKEEEEEEEGRSLGLVRDRPAWAGDLRALGSGSADGEIK